MSELPMDGFLVVADSPKARETMKNVCKSHDESVVRRFGRAVMFEPTEFGAFLSFWLRVKHGESVRIRRAAPVDDRRRPYGRARSAARAFADRENDRTPYPKFAAGTDHPMPDEMRSRTVLDSATGPSADHHRG